MSDKTLVRYTYRLRVSVTAQRALLAEWHRCRWVWNECVARSQRAYWAGEKIGPARLETGRTLGVDWGVTKTATTTDDGYDLPHPERRRTAHNKLARYQWMMARRRDPHNKRQSRGYRKAQRHAARQHRKVTRRHQDDVRKWAKRVAVNHDQIAIEDFLPKFLGKTTMARKAADAAIGVAKFELINMGRKHGRDVRLINPKYTTMDCGWCAARAKHALPLSERTYTCHACGTVSPRDKNSARVMLVRAGFVPAGVEGVRPGRPQDDRQPEPGISAPRAERIQKSNL